MLAQNFKTAAYLKITELEVGALIKVLGMLERGELVHHQQVPFGHPNRFDMDTWGENDGSCGTAHCIGGWAEVIGKVRFTGRDLPDSLGRLFYPNRDFGRSAVSPVRYYKISTEQAASALRNYLTLGEPHWREVFA